jgi:hypothetical protein
MSKLTNFTAMGLALAVVLVTASPAAAQSSKSHDPSVTQRKLQRSAELQRQALQALTDLGSAERLVKNAYDELKAAKDDMVIRASNTQFPDPLFPSNNRRMDQALALIQGAWDALKLRDKWSDPDSQVAGVRSNLQQALKLTNLVAATNY